MILERLLQQCKSGNKLNQSHIHLKKLKRAVNFFWTFLFRVGKSSVQSSVSIFLCSPRLFFLQVLVKLEDKGTLLTMWRVDFFFFCIFFSLFFTSPSSPFFLQLLPLWFHPSLDFTIVRLRKILLVYSLIHEVGQLSITMSFDFCYQYENFSTSSLCSWVWKGLLLWWQWFSKYSSLIYS